ncbi:beta-lactamase-like [Branchiostoma floridae]|uniref:Beta-lactamase-like n=1 Tax=Branchiostoma floridae TaxID=7739 RepID=A0A9J7L825_BRAFL|nr:beta-lactamase-like [Branchiostoma floridae]
MSLLSVMATAVKFVFFTFFISTGGAIDRSSSDLQQRLQDLDTFIQNLMTCESRPVVGLTVSVVKDGQTIFAKGYGQRDLQTGQAVDNRTLFGVGSISKSFTSALLAAILGERKDVSWDTVLTDILGPSFRFRDQFRTEEATLRDLLAHKMGLESLGLAVDVGQDIDRAELARRIRYYRQVYPIRTRWHYNNVMYTLAGHVAEKLTGKPYETLLRERILQPLGMGDTVYLADVQEEDGFVNFAQTYSSDNETSPFVPYSPENRRPVRLHLPAGGVVSNALDMARYMKFHLSGGRDTAGRQVVPEDTLRQTHTVDFTMPLYSERVGPDWPVGVDMLHGYGLGWMSGYYRGHRRVYHSGLVTGFTSLLSLFPAARGGVFTSVNGVRGRSKDVHNVIHHQIADILIGKDHWLNATTACSYPQPWWTRPKANDSVNIPETSDEFSRDKRDYEGHYGNRAVGTLTISLNATDEELYFKLGLIGHGVVIPTKRVNVLNAFFRGPLDGSTILVDVQVHGEDVVSLSFRSKPPEPDLLFERNLKVRDTEDTDQEWGGCSSTSGAMQIVMSRLGLSFVFILTFVILV